MEKSTRKTSVLRILKGVLAALASLVVGILALSLALVFLGLSDSWVTALNQAIKLLAVVVGARASVGLGGDHGFLIGGATGLLDMLLSYGLYCILDGSLVSAGVLTSEFLIGTAVGALAGAVFANLRPRRKVLRKKRTATA